VNTYFNVRPIFSRFNILTNKKIAPTYFQLNFILILIPKKPNLPYILDRYKNKSRKSDIAGK
jgi:hypothetical protein